MVGLRVHCFRFSARTALELPSSGWFLRLPFRSCRSASWPSGSLLPLFGLRRFGVAAGRVRSSAFRFGDSPRRVGLRTHGFRFSARTASEWPLGGLAFGLPLRSGLGGLVLPLGGLVFGLTASAFRHAPLRSGRWASWFFRLPLRKLPSAGWPSGSLLPLFGMRRFGVAAGRVGSSAFRFGDGRRASWPSGSLLPLFGTHRSAPPCRRSEDRRSTPTRHLFHFKTLIPTC